MYVTHHHPSNSREKKVRTLSFLGRVSPFFNVLFVFREGVCLCGDECEFFFSLPCDYRSTVFSFMALGHLFLQVFFFFF